MNIGKNYWLRKVNIDLINWEKLFIGLLITSKATYRDSLTLAEFWIHLSLKKKLINL